jgi:hypothetical protein
LEAESEDAGIVEREVDNAGLFVSLAAKCLKFVFKHFSANETAEELESVAAWLGHVPYTNQPRSRCRAVACNSFSTSVCVICNRSLCNNCYNKEDNHVKPHDLNHVDVKEENNNLDQVVILINAKEKDEM